jgi:hypothetical protein
MNQSFRFLTVLPRYSTDLRLECNHLSLTVWEALLTEFESLDLLIVLENNLPLNLDCR